MASLRLYDHAREHSLRPDVIISYGSGPKAAKEAEIRALGKYFPGIPVKNYKRAFGYTGKANNLLDLIAALVDDTISPGAAMLIAGVGLGYGVGYVLVKKGAYENG